MRAVYWFVLICISWCVLAEESFDERSPTVIVLDVSNQHFQKVAMDIKEYLRPSDHIIRMSVQQMGGPEKTRMRIERLMRWNNASLALPYAIFAPYNETERHEKIEQARTLSGDRMLCEIIPQTPELQARVFMSSGNYKSLNFFIEMCEVAFSISVRDIKLVGSCMVNRDEVRYMRTDSGCEEYDRVRDIERPRPDILVCVPASQWDALDTSPSAVLAAARYRESSTALVDCENLWSGGRPIPYVANMVHPLCAGQSDPALITVIDVHVNKR